MVLKEGDVSLDSTSQHLPICTMPSALINNDGRRKGAFQHPSPEAQTELIAEALKEAAVSDPMHLAAVECHGTGTALGDPIEVSALVRIWGFKHFREPGGRLIGSSKSNVGHTGAAAGIVGCIKACLSVCHSIVPATLHCRCLNPHIDNDTCPNVVVEVTCLRPCSATTCVGVSSFGLGGTNAHALIQRVETPGRTHSFETEVTQFKRTVFWHPSANQSLIQAGHGFPALSSGSTHIPPEKPWINNSKSKEYICSLDPHDERVAFLWEHKVNDVAVLPAAVWIDFFLQLGCREGFTNVSLQKLNFERPLYLSDGLSQFRLQVLRDGDYAQSYEVKATTLDCSVTFARAVLKDVKDLPEIGLEDSVGGRNVSPQSVDVAAIYRDTNSYGPNFQTVKEIDVQLNRAAARIEQLKSRKGFCVDPTILDGAFQVMLIKPYLAKLLQSDVWPQQVQEVCLHQCPKWLQLASAKVLAFWEHDFRGSFKIVDDQSQCCLTVKDLVFSRQKEIVSSGLLLEPYWEESRQSEADLSSSQGSEPSKRLGLAFLQSETVSLHLLEQVQKQLPSMNISACQYNEEQPMKEHEYMEAVSEVTKMVSTQDGVLVMYFLKLDHDQVNQVDSLDRLTQPCLGLLFLVKALLHHGCPVSRLLVVTSGSARVPSTESCVLSLAQSSLIGLCRAIKVECPDLSLCHVDVESRKIYQESELFELAQQLLSEANAPNNSELGIAIRHGVRYAWRLREKELPSILSSSRIGVDCGKYLITGGMGALGQEIGLWLCEQGVSQLILAGRNSKPCDRLTQKGVKIQIELGDMGKRHHVKDVLQTHGSRLTGLIHAAGVLRDKSILDLTSDDFDDVFHPKAFAAYLLHHESQNIQLQDFVLMSSISSTLGSHGQAPYAAANSFLDGLAALRQYQGQEALSINWGPWGEVGMAKDAKLWPGMRQLQVQDACDLLGQVGAFLMKKCICL